MIILCMLIASELPRYVRVNPLKSVSSVELTNELVKLGLKEVPYSKLIQVLSIELMIAIL